jgi:hypothetical protein
LTWEAQALARLGDGPLEPQPAVISAASAAVDRAPTVPRIR